MMRGELGRREIGTVTQLLHWGVQLPDGGSITTQSVSLYQRALVIYRAEGKSRRLQGPVSVRMDEYDV